MVSYISKFLVFLGVISLVTGCKLAVIVVEGGVVQSFVSGDCAEGAICISEDEDDTNFDESFTAVPNPGWHFARWNEGWGFFCGGSTDQTCVVSSVGFVGNAVIEEIIASDQVFNIMPIFEVGLGTLKVDGKEWAQAGLFRDLSWDDINAVCPAGICGDSGTLNGYDMTGWTWASIEDVKALFNGYIGDNVLDPGNDRYDDVTGQAIERFYADGWHPTRHGPQYLLLLTEWNVHLRDTSPLETGQLATGFARAHLARSRDVEPEFDGAVMSVLVGPSNEPPAQYTGAAFYR